MVMHGSTGAISICSAEAEKAEADERRRSTCRALHSSLTARNGIDLRSSSKSRRLAGRGAASGARPARVSGIALASRCRLGRGHQNHGRKCRGTETAPAHGGCDLPRRTREYEIARVPFPAAVAPARQQRRSGETKVGTPSSFILFHHIFSVPPSQTDNPSPCQASAG
jgi:hypothetical protein